MKIQSVLENPDLMTNGKAIAHWCLVIEPNCKDWYRNRGVTRVGVNKDKLLELEILTALLWYQIDSRCVVIF